jgi:porin
MSLTTVCVAFVAGAPHSANAQSAAQALSGPDATPNLLSFDAREKDDVLAVDAQQRFDAWKADFKQRTGLDFGVDYIALGYAASSNLGPNNAGGGAFRLFGAWTPLGWDGSDAGSLVFKLENRHAYGDVSLTDFGFELGYVGLVSSVFSDQGWRATHLYWQQPFTAGKGVALVGWLDVSDYVDVYALASPWTGFSNLAFQTGSGTIGGLPDGALGAMVGGFLSNNIYAAASIVDGNADATDLPGGVDTLFGDGETFKTIELGWTSGAKTLFIDNAHVTLWQIDARPASGSAKGHGLALSYTAGIDGKWLPFVRGGWSDGGGSLYQAAMSAGFGYTENPGRQLTGLGLNWSRPNKGTFNAKLDDQLTLEVFSRWQLTQGIELTPSVQIVRNPALNPDEDTIVLFGMRLRAAF